MLVPGAGLLTPEFCEKNPTESYNKNKLLVEYTKGKGKYKKTVKEMLIFKTRKNRLVRQNINICKEAYDFMLDTPIDPRFSKPTKASRKGVPVRIWDCMSVKERLKLHFDQIAHDFNAESYDWQILDD